MSETLRSQINRLATVIIDEVPGEPSQSEGAVDTAIRLIRELIVLRDKMDDLDSCIRLCWKGHPDVWERLDNWMFNLKRAQRENIELAQAMREMQRRAFQLREEMDAAKREM